jgi:hypothetical protein
MCLLPPLTKTPSMCAPHFKRLCKSSPTHLLNCLAERLHLAERLFLTTSAELLLLSVCSDNRKLKTLCFDLFIVAADAQQEQCRRH